MRATFWWSGDGWEDCFRWWGVERDVKYQRTGMRSGLTKDTVQIKQVGGWLC